jgi:hypothetical protein
MMYKRYTSDLHVIYLNLLNKAKDDAYSLWTHNHGRPIWTLNFLYKVAQKKIYIYIYIYIETDKWFKIYLCAVASRICLNLWIAESKLLDNEICVLEENSFEACSTWGKLHHWKSQSGTLINPQLLIILIGSLQRSH